MKLGILVTTDRHFDDVIGLARAAAAKGHEVRIFNMDAGTKLLENPGFTSLSKIPGISMSFCGHSAKHHDVNQDGIPPDINCGSQYNNAVMMHDCQKVINL
ncbi:MAG: hypothetical protein M0Z59_04225 [Nitrospiraceae bacterium]|nr:hypothetical protein [Nitrospiraceae bacterium]